MPFLQKYLNRQYKRGNKPFLRWLHENFGPFDFLTDKENQTPSNGNLESFDYQIPSNGKLISNLCLIDLEPVDLTEEESASKEIMSSPEIPLSKYNYIYYIID